VEQVAQHVRRTPPEGARSKVILGQLDAQLLGQPEPAPPDEIAGVRERPIEVEDEGRRAYCAGPPAAAADGPRPAIIRRISSWVVARVSYTPAS